VNRLIFICCFGLACFISACKNHSKSKILIEKKEEVEFSIEELKKVEKFARKFAKDLTESNNQDVAAAYNLDDFSKRIIYGLKLPKKDFEGFKKGMANSLRAKPGGLGWALVGNPWEYRGMTTLKGRKLPMLRAVFPNDEGVSYIHLMVQPDDNQQLKITDIHTLIDYEWMSTSTRRLVYPALESLLEHKNSSSGEEEELKAIRRFTEASNSSDLEKIHKIYQSLPEKFQMSRYIWSMYISSLPGDSPEYLEELEAITKAFPDDPGIAFTSIDLYFLKENWEKAAQAIDTVEKTIGNDGQICIFRANLFIEQKKFDEASKQIEIGLQLEPKSEDVRWTQFTLLHAQQDYEALVEALEQFETDFGVHLDEDNLHENIITGLLTIPSGVTYLEGE